MSRCSVSFLAAKLGGCLSTSGSRWLASTSNAMLKSMRPIPALLMTGGRRTSAVGIAVGRCSSLVCSGVLSSPVVQNDPTEENDATLGGMPLKMALKEGSTLASVDVWVSVDRADRTTERCDIHGVATMTLAKAGDDNGNTGEELHDDIGLLGNMAT